MKETDVQKNPVEQSLEVVKKVLRLNAGKRCIRIRSDLDMSHAFEVWQVGVLEVVLHLHFDTQKQLAGFDVLTPVTIKNDMNATLEALQTAINLATYVVTEKV